MTQVIPNAVLEGEKSPRDYASKPPRKSIHTPSSPAITMEEAGPMIGLQQGFVNGLGPGPFGALVCLASEQNKLRSGHAPERGDPCPGDGLIGGEAP
jgi:hypothetical protein